MKATTTTVTTHEVDYLGFSTICADCGAHLDESNMHPVSGDKIAYCIACAEQRMAAERLGFFFEAVAQVAERRVAEKKAAREAKKQANLSILARAQFKATGAVLVGIEDRNGKHTETFHTTIINGRVTSCVNAATGETCSGRRWSGHCCHGDRAMQYEAARAEQVHDAAQIAPAVLTEMVAHDDVQAHVEDSIRSGEFVDAPQVPGSCDLCGRWSKRAVCPWCLGVAA